MADVTEADVAIADQLVLEGRWREAVELLDAALGQNLAESGLQHLLPWIHRLLGLAYFNDDPVRAMEEIEQSLVVARERGASHEVALALQARQLLFTWRGESIDTAERREYLEIIGEMGIRPRREPPQPDRVLSGTGFPDQR